MVLPALSVVAEVIGNDIAPGLQSKAIDSLADGNCDKITPNPDLYACGLSAKRRCFFRTFFSVKLKKNIYLEIHPYNHICLNAEGLINQSFRFLKIAVCSINYF